MVTCAKLVYYNYYDLYKSYAKSLGTSIGGYPSATRLSNYSYSELDLRVCKDLKYVRQYHSTCRGP